MSKVTFAYHLLTPTDIEISVDPLIPWLEQICKEQGRSIQELSYILSTDDYILELNQSHLNHDFFTDILTFPYNYDPIHAEIYISIDRVKENANNHQVSFQSELLRVVVHGLLHMLGYNDHSPEDISTMRRMEDKYIQSFLTQHK